MVWRGEAVPRLVVGCFFVVDGQRLDFGEKAGPAEEHFVGIGNHDLVDSSSQ